MPKTEAQLRAGRAYRQRHPERIKAYQEANSSRISQNYKNSFAKRKYGRFWEVMLLVVQIDKEVIRRVPKRLDRLRMRGTYQRCARRAAMLRNMLYGWHVSGEYE